MLPRCWEDLLGSVKLRCLLEGPGRPPKRPHEIMGMGGLPGPMGPGNLPPPHLSPEALMALKKTRMDARDFPPFMNGGVPVAFPIPPDGDMEKSPLLSNGYNPPPKGLMAQYMALNGGMPHPALLAHTGLPLPPHPAPWAAHAAEHPFKNGPHPDSLARPPPHPGLLCFRSMVWENCRASYDEVLKHLERTNEQLDGCKTNGYKIKQCLRACGRCLGRALQPGPRGEEASRSRLTGLHAATSYAGVECVQAAIFHSLVDSTFHCLSHDGA
ncbi:hypothetical protein E2C01_033434 [Portunus trituberculatus]|uniref:Uncharacterized protein n=1 Tax=Portunus trituberculatus TaxID=210409 RepID=A0A5B7F048_PORTR|nr:hypothetical protein [Portunus trituberculatus]